MPPRARGRAGVTLLELLVAMTIAGLLLSVSVAAIGTLAERFADPGEALADAAEGARRIAARRSEPARLLIAADGAYHIVTPAGQRLETGDLPITGLSPAPVALDFYANGAAGGGSFCIRTAEGWRSLELDRVSGRLRAKSCRACCTFR